MTELRLRRLAHTSQWAKALVTLAVGTAVLAVSLRVPAASVGFYGWSIVLAVTWTAGAFWVGLTPHRVPTNRFVGMSTVRVSVITAAIVSGSFLAGGYVAVRIPVLGDQINQLVDRTGHQLQWPLIAVAAVTGIAEELFFRGALFFLIKRHAVISSTVIYTAVTAVTGNIGLIAAAAILGFMLALARRTSSSVIPAVVGHVAWTATTVAVLPLIV